MGGRLFWITLIAAPALTIRVSPQALIEQNPLHIICRVAPNPQNRWLNLGLLFVAESGRQLDGEHAPITYGLYVPHVPCAAERAYCRLVTGDGQERIVSQTITVVCEE